MPDIDWDLLIRYAAGDCTAEERAEVGRRLAAVPRYRDALAALGMVRDQTAYTVAADELRERVGKFGDRVVVTPFRRRLPFMKIAAAALLALGTAVGGYLAVRRAPTSIAVGTPTVHTITTARRQRMTLRLSDGTVVALAPASTLRFAGTYGAIDRSVQLDGEAAFTVSHDSARPFVVQTARALAKDLGTRFVVRAYAGDSNTDVVVAEGLVAVTRRNEVERPRPDSVLLSRGDRARVTMDGRVAVTQDVPLDSYFGWTEGRYVLHRALLRDVVPQLERWYDIELQLASPELGGRGFSTTLRDTDAAADVLRSIATVLNVAIQQTGPRRYLLRAK